MKEAGRHNSGGGRPPCSSRSRLRRLGRRGQCRGRTRQPPNASSLLSYRGMSLQGLPTPEAVLSPRHIRASTPTSTCSAASRSSPPLPAPAAHLLTCGGHRHGPRPRLHAAAGQGPRPSLTRTTTRQPGLRGSPGPTSRGGSPTRGGVASGQGPNSGLAHATTRWPGRLGVLVGKGIMAASGSAAAQDPMDEGSGGRLVGTPLVAARRLHRQWPDAGDRIGEWMC